MTTAQPITNSANTRDVQEVSETQLVAELLAGSADAWRQFARRYQSTILASIQGITRRFPHHFGAEDTREVYASFCLALLANDMKRLRCYRADAGMSLLSWLNMLARHAAYDHLRTIRRVPTGPDANDVFDLCSDGPSPDEACDQRRRAAQVAALVDELSDKDREFMHLYFGLGMTPESVAEQMGISVKTVYTKKHKIRARLESMLEDVRRAA